MNNKITNKDPISMAKEDADKAFVWSIISIVGASISCILSVTALVLNLIKAGS